MAYNYNNEVIDLLLKKNLGSSYTTSSLVSGQESQILEKFHNLQVFFDTITDKNESAFTWSSATNVTGGGTVKTLDNVAGESNPGYFTHIKKYENIPMTSVPGTEYRGWKPSNDVMKEKFKNVILGKSNFDFIISSNITSFETIYNSSSAFKPIINNGVLIFLGNVKPQGNNTITMKEVYIVEGYSGTFANVQLNDIADISSSNPLDKQPLIFDGSTQKWTEGSIKFDHFPIQGLGDLEDVDTTSVVPNDGIFWNGFDWSSRVLVHLMEHFSDIDTSEIQKKTVTVYVPPSLPANTSCLTTTTKINVINSSGNKYVFNNGYSYDSSMKYGLYTKTYTFTNIPSNHPIAILNSGNANISYVPKNSSAIIIKVSDGGFSTNSYNDYYTFKDSNNNSIYIGNGSFLFMRGQSYKFVADGISSSHPFFIYYNGTSTSSISGNSGEITFTIPNNHSLTSGALYYQCSNHSSMKANLSLLNKAVSGSTNDGTYDFYYGDVTVTVTGDFGTVSVYCYYHGYMGGENLLSYVTACNPSSGTTQQEEQTLSTYNDNKYPLSLVYDDISGNFKATRLQFPVTSINDISNVNTSTIVPQNNQILVWDDGFGEWVADNVSEPINHLMDVSGLNIAGIKEGEGIVLDPSGGNKFIVKKIPRKIDSINSLRDVNISGLRTQIPQWSQILKMNASDEAINDNFGSCVTMNSEYMLIGSYNANGISLPDVGKVYVWKKSYTSFSEYQILEPNIQGSDMNFGSSIAIKDNFVIIGAPNHTHSSKEKAGSVYYYKYNSGQGRWGILNNGPYKEDELIQHSSPTAFDRFGCSVSVDTYMIIGASGKGGTGKGKASIYKYQSNNWVYVKDIVGSTAASNDEFGHKVQTRGNQAFVSAPNHNNNRGIIYIFNRTNGGSENWGETQKIVNEGSFIGTNFGNDFSFGSEWGIIGSKRSGILEGQAYYVKYYATTERWGLQGTTDYKPNQIIVAGDGHSDDGFGYSVSIYGNNAVVGAYKKKEDGTNVSGGAYIYKYTGENYWILDKKINANDLQQDDEYGISVFIYDRYAVVGSWKEESSNTDLNAGAAYLFNIANPNNSGTRCLIYDTDVNRYVVGMITSAGVGVLIRNINQLRDISGAEWENTTDISKNSVLVYDDTLLPVALRYEVVKPGTKITISDISDVDLSGVETGKALIYDASLNKWIPGDAGGDAAGVGVFNAPPDPPTTGQMYYDSSDNKFYGRLIDTWEEVLTHGTGYFFGHSTDTLRDLSGVSSITSFSLIWENPVQRKSPIAAKNAVDKVDGDYYLPAINDMYIEIVPENQNYTGTGIKIGGKNLNTGVVSGNTTQKISVYSPASQQLTTGVIVYKTGESPSGFSGTKDKIELIGGKQVYRINPSTLTLTSGTTYKARVWFRNSSSADNKYKEIKGITL